MGSTDSIPQNNSHKLDLHNWQYKYQSEEHPGQYGTYNRLKNKMTGQQLIQYQLYLYDKDQYTQFMSMHELRNKNPNIVSISNINKQNIKQLCSTIYHLKVYIEDFPLRLCNIKDIPFPQNLYVLDRTLRGFHILFQNVGHFHLTEDLICINQQGIIKVWLNQDLSKSTPNYSNNHRLLESRTQKSKNIENSMIWQLITIVEQLTNKQTVPNGYSFIDFLDRKRVSQLDFKKIINLTTQYALQTESQIPEFFQSVIRIIRQKKGIYQSLIDINYNPKSSLRGKDSFNFAQVGNNFRQSKVQRIQSVKNPSSKSYVESESHTFADNLKKFDTSFRKQPNAFGQSSYLRDSPIKKTQGISRYNQRYTQKLSKRLSYSSLSSPKIQSLNNIGPAFGQRGKSQINNNAFSQILQKTLKQSKNPAKLTPPTYFSHIIQPVQHNQLLKKGTLFSFGQQQRPTLKKSQQHSRISKQIKSVRSSRHSNVNSELQKCYKPLVKFTYNLNSNIQQEKYLEKQQSIEESSIPISPPSIDKSLIVKDEQAKQSSKLKRNYFHSKPIKHTQSSRAQKKQQIKNKNQSTQTDPLQFFVDRTSLIKNANPLFSDKNEKFKKKPYINYFRQTEGQSEFQTKKIQHKKASQINSVFSRNITVLKPDSSENKNEKISFRKKNQQKSMKIICLPQNQLGLDHEIYLDLMRYQQEKLQKEKFQKNRHNND